MRFRSIICLAGVVSAAENGSWPDHPRQVPDQGRPRGPMPRWVYEEMMQRREAHAAERQRARAQAEEQDELNPSTCRDDEAELDHSPAVVS